MKRTPENKFPQHPRCILTAAAPILPYFVTAPLSPLEIIVEKLAYAAEVSASRPAWQIALVGALAALEWRS